jgi:hypothetical protein
MCEDLFTDGTATLDELLSIRRDREPEPGEETVAQHGIRTATTVLQCVDPEEVRHNEDVQDLCLALGVAVERLAALEQSGIPT